MIRIIQGDALDELAKLPAESVHCCVTSPPYFGLRDYGIEGQLGMEDSPQEYVNALVAVFHEVRRVMRDDATIWLNLGDSYTGSGKGGNPPDSEWKGFVGNSAREAAATKFAGDDRLYGLPRKNLIGIPWRVAFALQADGWYLRQDIIWAKPNPMPESVRDRCTKAHEYLFLLAKSEKYYCDMEAIAEKGAGGRQRFGGDFYGAKGLDEWGRNDQGRHDPEIAETRNKRSVWTVATQPYSEAHFATFPPALIEPCILAGCPVGGTVLDPFGGAGTTGLVADRLQRSAILIELNPSYADMARKRVKNDAPLFADVA